MKKLLFVLLAFIAFNQVVQAQPPGRGMPGPEAMAQQMKDSLGLSAVQVDSVSAVLKEFMPRQREIFMNRALSREEKAEQMKELIKARNARLEKILSGDQFKKLLEMEERRRNQREGQRPGGN